MRSKQIIVATFSIAQITVVLAQAPDWSWARHAGGSSGDYGYSIAVDGDGNTYVTGRVSGSSVTFGATVLTTNGSDDAFVAKYDPAGNVLWAHVAGGGGVDMGNGLAVDVDGNCYVTGVFLSSSITFGLTTLTNSGAGDVFVVKFDTAGNILWAKKAGGSGGDGGNAVAVDDLGNCYVTGGFGGNIVFGSFPLSTMGGVDVFVAKYDPMGVVLWAESAGGAGGDGGTGIAVDGDGNSYITGFFNGTMTIDSVTLMGSGSNDVFVVKYDPAGNEIWSRSWGGPFDDRGAGIAVDGNGSSYVTGFFTGPMNADTVALNANGGSDVFIAKCDAAGTLEWATGAGSALDDRGTGIAVDAGGNCQVTGWFSGAAITFGLTTLSSGGNIDVFVASYDAGGSVAWAASAGGAGIDRGRGISLDADGNGHVTGSFDSGIVFGPDALTPYASSDDVFVAKLAGLATHTERHLSMGLVIRPTPFWSAAILELGSSLDRAVLTINDALGRTVREITNLSGNSIVLERGNLPAGTYFFRLVDDGQVIATTKVMVAD